ncbi:MAG: phosphatase PAP2 family protein [Mycobacterium sp.]|nr:phosphatase PAP2 family protein [Mycobacterium sp.]HKI40763.1 phosphatase PAP2 family protein [Mycobacterium sp.]
MTRPRSALAIPLAVAAVAVYALMWAGYRQQWGWLHRVDWSLLNCAHDIAVKHPLWVRFWDGLSFALGPAPLRLLGMVATVAALVRRDVRAALVLLACAPLNGFVTLAAKSLVNRPRPPTMLVAATSTSFPSGHALEAMAALLAMLAFVRPMLSRAMGGVAIALVAVCVLAVGIGRVALNVHYPSDVLAGWSLGYLYFLLCMWVFRPPGDRWSRRGDPTGSKALLDP